jgi:protein-S-isoprenylcysteine O-methyltransferase Ste14
MLIAVLQGLARGFVLALVLFASAGRMDLPFFWGFIAICTVMGVLAYHATARHAGLMEEQLRPKGKGSDGMVSVAALVLMVIQWVLAGRDIGHYHWTPPLPMWLQVAGLAAMAAAYSFGYWALLENPFFSPVVRVQEDRGHSVVASGPYQHVRHPAYLGTCVGMVGGAIGLGSFAALIPAAVVCVLYVRRTMIEDAFLRSNLAGYEDYYQRVRYALFPGIW